MKFLIITHVIHKKDKHNIYGYAPYIKEMNLWLKYVDEVIIVAPIKLTKVTNIDLAYKHNNLKFIKVPHFNLTSILNIIKTAFFIPFIFFKIVKNMSQVEHIHLRCPGNMGLLGSIAQIFFPKKIKTVKYAGNWDKNSKQPFTYRLQKYILSNTFLSKNIKVLVYGEWENQSKNIVPFFTATYSEVEKSIVFPSKNFNPKEEPIRLIYVGALSSNKRPFLSIEIVHNLIKKGYNVLFDIFGDGEDRKNLETYVKENNLEKMVKIYGNQKSEVVKDYYQKAHFIIFLSKSEGWPKVVAEAMFWGCLPITTDVSCVNYMIGYGKRGKVVNPNIEDSLNSIEEYIKEPKKFEENSKNAIEWSREYTIEKFEKEIGELIYG